MIFAFQLLFVLALVLWIAATVVVTRLYIETLANRGLRYPFVIASAWVGLTSIAEAMLFLLTAVWALDSHDQFRTVVLFYIPSALAVKAVAYIVIGLWVVNGGPDEIGS